MKDPIIAFDLEIAKIIPDDFQGDILELMPLGITCAATLRSDEKRPRLWYSRSDNKDENTFPFAPKMTQGILAGMLTYLNDCVGEGYRVVTFNGLRFDWQVLARELDGYGELSGNAAAHAMSRYHVDMMYHFFCVKGHRVGLEAAVRGAGLPGKLHNIDGLQAPVLWRNGECKTVCEYVAHDVTITRDLYYAVLDRGGVFWVSQRGRPNFAPIGEWLSVEEATNLPPVDNSWMSAPEYRKDFYGWTGKEIAGG